MTAVLFTALGASLGLLGIVLGLRPTGPSLRTALAELERQPTVRTLETSRVGSSRSLRPDRRLANQLSPLLENREFVRSRLSPLLAITGSSAQELCGQVILGFSVGVLLPGAWWAVVTAAGAHLPIGLPVWGGLALGLGGAALPLLVLHGEAKRARLSARKVVGSFLNLVVLCLAGGMGIESALHASARIGQDAVSERILDALVLAQDAGEPPWDALDRLGRDLGLSELAELAAAVSLAGAEGARIRSTLTAKASSIRRHNLATAEAQANAVTERLFLPGVFLLVGFLAFIAYPAIARISSGL